jgi:hypothetical protein
MSIELSGFTLKKVAIKQFAHKPQTYRCFVPDLAGLALRVLQVL